MTPSWTEGELLDLRLRMEALITERAGYEALNKEREHRGEALAYGEQAFVDLGRQFSHLASVVRGGL